MRNKVYIILICVVGLAIMLLNSSCDGAILNEIENEINSYTSKTNSEKAKTTEAPKKSVATKTETTSPDNWYETTYNDYISKLKSAYDDSVKDIQAKVDKGIGYDALTDLIAEKMDEITDVGAEGIDLMADHAVDYPLTSGDYMNWSTKLTMEATEYSVKIETKFMSELYSAMFKDAFDY